MMVGTSPSVTFDGNSYVIAFHADTGNLWTYSEAHGNANNLGRGMMRVTNPSIAALNEGGWKIAFQADDGHLRIHPDDADITNRKAGMDGHTSPGIVDAPSSARGYVQHRDADNQAFHKLRKSRGCFIGTAKVVKGVAAWSVTIPRA
jgi:hypothetical protein